MSDMLQMPSLVLGDRINYPFIIASAILKFHDAIIKVEGEQSEQEVREAAVSLYNSIPSSWWDDKFQDDKKKAVIKEKVDMRREWCGRKVGKPKFKTELKVEPYKLFHACIDLIDRRHLLNKVISIEKQLGLLATSDGKMSFNDNDT